MGRLYSGGGGRKRFGDVLGELKIKSLLSRGGGASYIASGIFFFLGGGVRCVPLVFASIQSPDPPYPN